MDPHVRALCRVVAYPKKTGYFYPHVLAWSAELSVDMYTLFSLGAQGRYYIVQRGHRELYAEVVLFPRGPPRHAGSVLQVHPFLSTPGHFLGFALHCTNILADWFAAIK
jgi:hypothetical protein